MRLAPKFCDRVTNLLRLPYTLSAHRRGSPCGLLIRRSSIRVTTPTKEFKHLAQPIHCWAFYFLNSPQVPWRIYGDTSTNIDPCPWPARNPRPTTSRRVARSRSSLGTYCETSQAFPLREGDHARQIDRRLYTAVPTCTTLAVSMPHDRSPPKRCSNAAVRYSGSASANELTPQRK